MPFPRAASVLVVATALLLASPQAASAATFVVNLTSDQSDAAEGDGRCDINAGTPLVDECTLRAALEQSGSNPDNADEIDFNLTGGTTISPAMALPTATNVTIDGFSQSGSSPGTPLVEIAGTSAGVANGLTLGDASVVKGLVINRFDNGDGISIPVGQGQEVEGSFIGTNVAGDAALPNGNGVEIANTGSPAATIGGTTAAERNVISGNGNYGVSVGGGGPLPANQVQGNYIGTDKTGEEELGNAEHGVLLQNAGVNTVGGTTAGARNVISANGQSGVKIQGNAVTGSTGNFVRGNYIGTDKDGNEDLGNTADGVFVETEQQKIGGTGAGAGNVISGNDSSGVRIGLGGSDAVVQGNLIGTDAGVFTLVGNSSAGVLLSEEVTSATIGGTTPGAGNLIAANGGDGVQVFFGGEDRVVEGNLIGLNLANGVAFVQGADGRVGGQASGAPNLIAANGGDGVLVAADEGERAEVSSNSIFSNAGLGIDLLPDGVTPNDPGDVDAGPSDLQNFPVLNLAVSGGTTTDIEGSISSEPNETYRIEFFSNDACDPSQHGEGQQPLGSTGVAVGPSGTANFSHTAPVAVDDSDVITATATDPGGNTSEFSECEDVIPRPSLRINNVTVVEGDGGLSDATFTVTLSNPSPQTVSVDFETQDRTAIAPGDYRARTGTLFFGPGDTTETIRVRVRGDTLDEDTENYRVFLTNPDNAAIADGQGIGRITDDD